MTQAEPHALPQGLPRAAPPPRSDAFYALLRARIVILDGAMGTMIQRHGLPEAQFRGERFADWPIDLRGNNDLLSITAPEIIEAIHREYLSAGADVIATNTFNSNVISQGDYRMEALVAELNTSAARIARRVADAFSASRLGPDSGYAFGTLPAGSDFATIVPRALPAL